MGSWADHERRIGLLLAASGLAHGGDRDELIERGLRPEDADFVAEAGPVIRVCLARIAGLEEELAVFEARRRELRFELEADDTDEVDDG